MRGAPRVLALSAKAREAFLFGLNFLKNPARNGSVIPSSAFASAAVICGIDFWRLDVIVELGPGTGPFTEEIVRRAKPGTKIFLIEIEKSYITALRRTFGGAVLVEQASAHRLDAILAKHHIQKVDLIVSSIPSAIVQSEPGMLKSLKRHTVRGTIFRFITCAYMVPFTEYVYKGLPIRRICFVAKNFPPLWIYGVN